MSAATGAIVLGGRILFAYFFGPVAGVGHLRRSKVMEQYSRGVGFPIPPIAGWPTGAWLIVAAVSIALGLWPDIGALMIAAFLIPAALYFHRYWAIEDQTQKMTQRQFFWRNVIGVGASAMMFGTFVALGPALRFTLTRPLFRFRSVSLFEAARTIILGVTSRFT
jgi:putative oxidoreductase